MKSRSPSGSNSAHTNGQQHQPSPPDTSRTESMDTGDKQITKTERHHTLVCKMEKGEGKYLGTLLNDDEELNDDPRARTSSMDTHSRQVNQSALMKLLEKFKNPSASFPSLGHQGKHTSSSKSSKHSSRSGSPLTKSRSADSSVGSNGNLQQQGAPRRRFVRVVRDQNAPPPEQVDDNPHTRVSYTQEFLAKHYSQRPQKEEVKPYTTTGHTILKKSSGSGGELTVDPLSPADHESGSPSVSSKRATFFGEVEVLEYSLQDTIVQPHATHTTPIRYDDDGIEAEQNSTPGLSSNSNVGDGSSVDELDNGVEYKIASGVVSFNNPSPTEEVAQPALISQECKSENKENMQVDKAEATMKSSELMIDSINETKLKPDLLSNSFNYIFSPIGETGAANQAGGGQVISEVTRLKATNERSGSPSELDMRAKSLKLMSTATKPSSHPSLLLSSNGSKATNGISQSVSMPAANSGTSSAPSLDGSNAGMISPTSSPRGSLCALQNLGTLQRRGTEDEFKMSV